jgi:hypothetical protein
MMVRFIDAHREVYGVEPICDRSRGIRRRAGFADLRCGRKEADRATGADEGLQRSGG